MNSAQVAREVAALYRLAADCLDDDDAESAYNAIQVAAFHAEPLAQQAASARAIEPPVR